MIEIKGIGSYDSIPELASYVIDENINIGLDNDEHVECVTLLERIN